MKIIPRNKQLRGVLLGCAALSAVMAGPMLVDATAQALPTAGTCLSGGVCLTGAQAAATTTETTTVPVTTTQITTLTVPFTTTETNTITNTSTETITSTVPAATTTVTQPVTTTVTVTSKPTYPGYPGRYTTTTTDGRDVRRDLTTTSSTTTGSTTSTSSSTTGPACGTPGTTSSPGSGEVEICGPTYGHVAVYAATPGLYNSIDDTTSSYYVSAGLFAPQFRFGFLDGCYYVPDPSSVADPGQTVTTGGTLTNAVAFGLYSRDVSHPIRVPRFDCGGNPPTGAGQPGAGQPGLRR
jgi:hypothetical protein